MNRSDSILLVKGLWSCAEAQARTLPADAIEATLRDEEVAAHAHLFDYGITNYAADAGSAEPVAPDGWLAPIEEFIAEMIRRANGTNLTDAQWVSMMEYAIDSMPFLFEQLDVDGLAGQMEAGMGQAALSAIVRRTAELRLIRSPVAPAPTTGFHASLAVTNYYAAAPGVVFAPVLDAVSKLDRKIPIALDKSSAEWAQMAIGFRDRAQFSAHVTSVRFLSELQAKMRTRLSMAKEAVDYKGKSGAAFVDRDSFVRDMRRVAEEEGLQTTDEAGRGTVRDIRSVERLKLIYDMQDMQASGYARWNMDNDPDIMDEFPAYRLSDSTAREPRPVGFWNARWATAYSQTGGRGAMRGQFVALKTSPIWMALSTFGSPWPPFDWGSTRVLVDVDRNEAQALGLLLRNAPVPRFEGGSDRAGFNDTLEASLDQMGPEWTGLLAQRLKGVADIVGDVLKWKVNHA